MCLSAAAARRHTCPKIQGGIRSKEACASPPYSLRRAAPSPNIHGGWEKRGLGIFEDSLGPAPGGGERESERALLEIITPGAENARERTPKLPHL
jgi:hypothetical protein